ncbi:unnamed protein product, partial [Mesorhabditis belari]|uniref:Uncharacterized protein n=1 Tax=Mesorhabditis belari TaxID=2138241 RepID=A0AAF3ETQ5_9BILA
MITNLQKLDEELSIREQIARAVFQSTFSENSLVKYGPHIGSEFTPSRLFGGQMIAQSHSAFRQLYPNDEMNSLSFKFLAPGSCDKPISYSVERLGSLARVGVIQDKKMIAICTIKIRQSVDEFSIIGVKQPIVPDPETMDKDQQFFKELGAGREIDLNRILDAVLFEIYKVEMNDQRMRLWTRIHPKIKKFVNPEDRIDVCLMYTDFFTFQVCSEHLSKFNLSLAGGTSLSHNVYLHMRSEDIDVYEYHLFEVTFVAFSWNRALLRCVLYKRTLEPIMSVHQECFIQPKVAKIPAKL